MHYVIPEVINRPGTVIAVNVGGALIPGLLSVYLYVRNRIWISAFIATLLVAIPRPMGPSQENEFPS